MPAPRSGPAVSAYGNVGLAVGTRNSNANAALNARRGKVSLSSALNGWMFY